MNHVPNEVFMRRAIELSRQGWPMPNPHVGCVIVRGGEIVGEGFHAEAGQAHAEANALEDAGERAEGADVYVTLEPCNHQGRTPPCSRALIRAKVRSVTYAVDDPNPHAAGGADTLRAAGIAVESGFLKAEAEEANAVWLTAMRRQSPYITLKAAITVDGRIARGDGTSKWITGEAARAAARELRAEMGSVLVGRQTVESDDPKLTARIPDLGQEPLRIVLDPLGTLEHSHRIFSEPGEAWQVIAGEPNGPFQCPCPMADGGFVLEELILQAWDRGVRGILVEGGARTLRSFVEAGLFDRIELFVGPMYFGEGASWLSDGPLGAYALRGSQLLLDQVRTYDSDVRLTYLPGVAQD